MPVGLLLAAGLGTRYDPSGRCLKLLQPAPPEVQAGIAIVAAAARNLRSAAGQVLAVVRPSGLHQTRLHALLLREGCRLVLCEDADRGIGASLACGVRASRNADGWIVALGDMPAIAPQTIRSVVAALAGGHPTAAPVYRGQRGHPVGFSARCLDALLACDGESGARSVLESFSPQLIPVDDAGVLMDIDRP